MAGMAIHERRMTYVVLGGGLFGRCTGGSLIRVWRDRFGSGRYREAPLFPFPDCLCRHAGPRHDVTTTSHVTTSMLTIPESGMVTVAPLLGTPALPRCIPTNTAASHLAEFPPQYCNGFILLDTDILERRSIGMTHTGQELGYTDLAATAPAVTFHPLGAARQCLSLSWHSADGPEVPWRSPSAVRTSTKGLDDTQKHQYDNQQHWHSE